MSIQAAATSLYAHFKAYGWFITVGIGKRDGTDILFAYVDSQRAVNRLRKYELKAGEWEGHPVIIRKAGGLAPA